MTVLPRKVGLPYSNLGHNGYGRLAGPDAVARPRGRGHGPSLEPKFHVVLRNKYIQIYLSSLALNAYIHMAESLWHSNSKCLWDVHFNVGRNYHVFFQKQNYRNISLPFSFECVHTYGGVSFALQ